MTTIKMTFNGDNNADIFNGDNNADIFNGDNNADIFNGDNNADTFNGDNNADIFNGDNNADIFNGDNNADNDKMLSEQGGQLTLSAFSAMMTLTIMIMLRVTKCCQNRQVNSHCPHSQR